MAETDTRIYETSFSKRQAIPNDKYSPTWVAAKTFLAEVLRKWLSLLFMLFMPTFYFFVMYFTSDANEISKAKIFDGTIYQIFDVNDRDFKAMYLATLGISVTSAFAALTMMKGSIPVMRRLRLMGYSASTLLFARVLVLLLITIISTLIFTGIIAALLTLKQLVFVSLAMFQIGLIAVSLGTLLGVLFSREFEASMIIIAICGIQVALGRSGLDAEKYLLFYPPIEVIKTSGFTNALADTTFIGLGFLYALVLLGLALIIWLVRTRVWRHTVRH